jgi:hypothetical protein
MKTIDSQTKMTSIFSGDENGEAGKSFRAKFDAEPFLFRHRLSEEPRFELERIRALARRLPGKISFSGDLDVRNGFRQPGGRGKSFEEALDGLEKGQSWIILKKIHRDAEYASLLRDCLSEVEALTHRRLEPLIESRTMSLILSSPGQVTPYHIDADCNFLFQIRGCKTFYVFNGRDRDILPEKEEEDFWAGELNAAQYREENQAKAWSFAMKPGNGVHVPVIFPHWVKNDDNLSVSLSINFRFLGRLRGDVYRTNHLMRKLGLRPRPVGESRLADSLKMMIMSPPRSGIQMVRRLLQGRA